MADEEDIGMVVSEFNISRVTATMALDRLGFSTTVAVLHAVGEIDPTFALFENNYRRIDRVIPRMQRAVRALTHYGLTITAAIDMFSRFGDQIYSRDFNPLAAAAILAQEHQREEAGAYIHPAVPLGRDDPLTLEEDVDRNRPLCPHYLPPEKIRIVAGRIVPEEQERHCLGSDCTRRERPVSCMQGTKALHDVLGTSRIPDFGLDDPEANYVLTLLNRS